MCNSKPCSKDGLAKMAVLKYKRRGGQSLDGGQAGNTASSSLYMYYSVPMYLVYFLVSRDVMEIFMIVLMLLVELET